ncbi:hypothetical protein ACFFKU_01085 [Kineococcus gynurae]|uniref:Uncharacterized protein n=1 Tax=Kineococcus gynurae TaxID=452979 RepID=A0ABV5LPW8_9ACTN
MDQEEVRRRVEARGEDASEFLASTPATDAAGYSEEAMLVEEVVTRLENVEDGTCTDDRVSRVRRWH